MTKKKLNEKMKALRLKVKRNGEMCALLLDAELLDYVFPETNLGPLGGEVLHITSLSELKPLIKKLHLLFPNIRRIRTETWSPYADKAITAWRYHPFTDTNLQLSIWLETDICHVPSGVLTPKCKFIERTETKYDLVCEVN